MTRKTVRCGIWSRMEGQFIQKNIQSIHLKEKRTAENWGKSCYGDKDGKTYRVAVP